MRKMAEKEQNEISEESLSLNAEKQKEFEEKSRKKKKKEEDDLTPGIVYVGHIPHGFYEREMRGFFSQFGTVNRLRLSRSKKTGGSKGYAFVEFACDEVAKIVAETMNNYMMFGRLLKCNVVSKEKIHPRLWAGCNRRFRSKLSGPTNTDIHNKPRSLKQNAKRIGKLVAKEGRKRAKLEELGIDYSFPGYKAMAGERKQKSKHIKFEEA
ncbi:MKI67 FHA domain-interacting nucleolar phosphoprotein-like [Xenia sp. Carnegie-2017]|uniref:MKI67 FHA domain-interacting nucleolar phosphoprotein-like n=1 Tax=Xenia sp. Carnegie-2017 TaxID=2897299 RepID=UPI001F035137|nr:MKI67 FHA domain-interacting nucleolar phosphoprotein-like [Xenia sp. Carnegie-2017]